MWVTNPPRKSCNAFISTAPELQRLYFHRAFQCLQWFNVAIFKDRVGLSKDLNMDFNAVAFMFLGMAKELLENYDNL